MTHSLELQDEDQWVGIGTGTPDECRQLAVSISTQRPFETRTFRIVPIQAEKPRRRGWARWRS